MVGPTSNDWQSLKREVQMQTSRGGGSVLMEADTEASAATSQGASRVASHHQKPEEAGRVPLWSLRREHGLLAP